ncbi:nuclear telomere cap complex subunit Ten1 [Aspergillus candidus]|uniref:CST complex subunit Ten1 n=1 Tax=Aspergillus candidus TaxID=41067 RepID=A0A2I2F7G1_ASPCN|nr:CST complex subunit Ten1 [Aspergillus candidus]PLB36571.1 CST complex subunit Ten1 [Aspergillus candidus]
MTTPLPSTRAFLSDLPSLPPDTKVRFLGCVKTYSITTGHLTVEHNYPPQRPPPSVSVDVNAIIGSLTSEELRVGAWVNVVGYVRRVPTLEEVAAAAESPVHVDAVMVFPAGAIALGEYEQTLSDVLEVDRWVRRP